MKCAVANCGNSSKTSASECSLFTFPVDPELRKKWIKFCRQSKDFNFKTCYICMDHFASEDFDNIVKFEMGFAKKRMLKRGAVPSFYKQGDENPERSQRVQRRQHKKTFSDVHRQSDDSDDSQETEFICDEAIEDADKNTDPLQVFEQNEDNCALEAKRFSYASALHVSLANRSNSAEEIENLQAQLETLQRENESLQKENGRLQSEVTALKRSHLSNEKKNAYSIDVMEKRAWRAENACKNMEEKLEGIFTKHQIEKLKNGVKRPSWSEKDIAQSITLYAAGAKFYKLMYSKGFPLPAVRTLQTWSQKN